MQQELDDATTPPSPSDDKSMKDKRDEARRMAEELIAEEASNGKRRSLVSAYLIAVIVGLAFWAAVYYLWFAA